MKKSLKHFGAVATMVTALSACDNNPFPEVDGIDLETPVAQKVFSEKVNKVLKYCGFVDSSFCNSVYDSGMNAQRDYLNESKFVREEQAYNDLCHRFYDNNEFFDDSKGEVYQKDSHEECAYILDGIYNKALNRSPQASKNAQIVFENARGEYIQSEIDNNNPEIPKILDDMK